MSIEAGIHPAVSGLMPLTSSAAAAIQFDPPRSGGANRLPQGDLPVHQDAPHHAGRRDAHVRQTTAREEIVHDEHAAWHV